MAHGPRPATREERLELAREVCNRLIATRGAGLVGVATCGAVARGTDGPHATLEMVACLRQPEELPERRFVARGIPVSLALLPAEEFVRGAARVTPLWPLTAEGYRSLSPVYDPADFFGRVRQVALNLPRDAFRIAIRHLVIAMYAHMGELRAAGDAQDEAGIRSLAGALARDGALLAGLANRACYASEAEMLPRSLTLPLLPDGYGRLVGLLAAGELEDVQRLYQACAQFWTGVDRFAQALAIRYRDDEIPL